MYGYASIDSFRETGWRCMPPHTRHTYTSPLYIFRLMVKLNQRNPISDLIPLDTRLRDGQSQHTVEHSRSHVRYISIVRFLFSFSSAPLLHVRLFLLHIVAQGQFICLVLVFLFLHSLCWRATAHSERRVEERTTKETRLFFSKGQYCVCWQVCCVETVLELKIDSAQWYIGWKFCAVVRMSTSSLARDYIEPINFCHLLIVFAWYALIIYWFTLLPRLVVSALVVL